MSRQEFIKVFDKICKYYDKTFQTDKDMAEIYFNEMKRINDRYDYFEELLYRKCKFFPKITDIIEIKYKMDENNKKTIDINTKVCECNNCRGTGYIIITDEYSREFAVACDCKNGDNKLYDGRTIKDVKYRTTYLVPRYSERF